MEKLRILCLHGYHGSARVLQDQMRPFAQALDHLAEFIYVDAPSIAQGDFGWWHAARSEAAPRAGDPGVAPAPARYEGWSRTREAIASIFDREGPFDGVFGFSQGAALAALLVGLRSPDALPAPHRPLVFDFVIMAGAFLANDPALAKFYSARASYDLPSVHIVGQADSIVPATYSYKVAALFKDPLVLQHDGGHVIASTPSIHKQIVAFLQQRAE
jgi:predicted esterase